MLLHVLSYDRGTGYGEAIAASLFQREDYPKDHVINIYSKLNLEIDNTYSFYPKNKWIGSKFIRAELDYHTPYPINENTYV